MIVFFIIVPIVSALTKSRPANTEEMFSCYDKKVLVPAEHSLEEE